MSKRLEQTPIIIPQIHPARQRLYDCKRAIDFVAEKALAKPGITADKEREICQAADWAILLLASPLSENDVRLAIGDFFRATDFTSNEIITSDNNS